jgi:hypothetical protein
MKRLAIFVPLAFASEAEICMDGAMNDADHDEFHCFGKSIGKATSWIEHYNCPDGENSSNPACAGGTAPWNARKQVTYRQMVQAAIRNYGCNCFSTNKKIEHPNPARTNKISVPGVNGEPIDELDVACLTLAKRYKCLGFDFPEDLEGGYQRDCHYNLGYSSFISNGELECGTERNPFYASESNWYNRPSNLPRKNTDKCRGVLCAMEQEFAQNVAELLEDPFQFYRNNRDNYGISESGQCTLINRNNAMDECCGSEFARFPFNPTNKRCCDGMVVEVGSSDEVAYC